MSIWQGRYHNYHRFSPESASDVEKEIVLTLKNKDLLYHEKKEWPIPNHSYSRSAQGYHYKGTYPLFMEELPEDMVAALVIRFEQEGTFRSGCCEDLYKIDRCVGLIIRTKDGIFYGEIRDPAKDEKFDLSPGEHSQSKLYWCGYLEGWRAAGVLNFENRVALLKIRNGKTLHITLAPVD